MKAIQFDQAGPWIQQLKLTEIALPEVSSNSVEIEIKARPINPSDEMFIGGAYRIKPIFPQIAGMEGSGIIVKTGRDVDPELKGRHVAFLSPGTWAEKIHLTENQFRFVPPDIPFEVSCQLSLNTLTAYALLESSQLYKGQWLLLTAANSSVGRQVIQMAKERGINIVALVRNPKHVKALIGLGAHDVLLSSSPTIAADISAVCGAPNAVIDAIGGTLGSALIEAIATFGKIIIYGRLSEDVTTFSYGTVIYKNLSVEGFGINHWLSKKSAGEIKAIWEDITQKVIDGRLKVNYESIYKLESFEQAILEYETSGGRIILT